MRDRSFWKALELDDTLAEAHAALAYATFFDWDWPGAGREFKRAIELNPNSALSHARYAECLKTPVGVPDYRAPVDQKLRTAGELYRFMVDQFNQTRSFVLELAVVIILVIKFFFLFRGK